MITLEEAVALIPQNTYLSYVDYTDSLDERIGLIGRCIRENSLDALYEEAWEWYDDSEWEWTCHVMNELRVDLERLYDEDEVLLFMELNEDYLRDVIRDRDASTPVDDLIRNTRNQIFFYSFKGDFFNESWCMSPMELAQTRFAIRKLLGMPRKNEGLNVVLDELIQNASYGGELRIYFEAPFEDIIFEGEKTIRFSGKYVSVGLINQYNGSGHSVELPLDITIPFDRSRLHLERASRYNWTWDIAGMCEDWCSRTNVELL